MRLNHEIKPLEPKIRKGLLPQNFFALSTHKHFNPLRLEGKIFTLQFCSPTQFLGSLSLSTTHHSTLIDWLSNAYICHSSTPCSSFQIFRLVVWDGRENWALSFLLAGLKFCWHQIMIIMIGVGGRWVSHLTPSTQTKNNHTLETNMKGCGVFESGNHTVCPKILIPRIQPNLWWFGPKFFGTLCKAGPPNHSVQMENTTNECVLCGPSNCRGLRHLGGVRGKIGEKAGKY